MAVVRKSYLDLTGLQTYDQQIKGVITDVEELIPTFSVNDATETLVINVPSITVISNNNSNNEGE